MPVKLLIVESPTKARKIGAFLGAGWKVEASIGHIRDLPERSIGVLAPDFEPEYELTDRGKDVVAKLKKLVGDATDIYLATDPDREGEAISWHLQQALRLRNPKRVTFNEITSHAVRSAVTTPRAIDSRLVAAQEARRVLDRLVGYMVSPAVSNRVGTRLSAGRVQSPALRLVVERERAIDGFKSKIHYGVRLAFGSTSGIWTADWDFSPLLAPSAASETASTASDTEESAEQPERHWTDRAFAEKVARLRELQVLQVKDAESRSSPPAPFTTSTLQQGASATLGMGPDATMKAAQGLFDEGHITYHRTDSPNLSEESVASLRGFLKANNLSLSPQPRTWKSKANAQEAHEAIRPTDFSVEEAGNTPEERNLYRLIRRRTMASQMADALYATRRIDLESAQKIDGRPMRFVGRGRTLTSPGWLALTDKDATSEDTEEEMQNPVPKLPPGTAVVAKDGHLLEKLTQPPPRFSEAGLIKELERQGIGRPSTYAAILSGLGKRGYIEIRKKRMHPTQLAYQVVDALVGRFQFIDLGFTRAMEEDLDLVAGGERAYLDIVRACHESLSTEISALGASPNMPHADGAAGAPTETYPCPKCRAAMRRIKGPKGFFWGCGAFRETGCKGSMEDSRGKPVPRTEATAPDANNPCPLCQTAMRRIKGPKGFFWGCSAFREAGCKGSMDDKDGKPAARIARAGGAGGQSDVTYPCPECGRAMRLRNGRKGQFWGCSGYPGDCNKTAEDVGGKPDFVEAEAA